MGVTKKFRDYTTSTLHTIRENQEVMLAVLQSQNATLMNNQQKLMDATTMARPFAAEVDRAEDLDGDVVVLAAMRGERAVAELAFAQCAREWSGSPGLRWRVYHHDGAGKGLAVARDALGIQPGATVIAVRVGGQVMTSPLPESVTPDSLHELVGTLMPPPQYDGPSK